MKNCPLARIWKSSGRLAESLMILHSECDILSVAYTEILQNAKLLYCLAHWQQSRFQTMSDSIISKNILFHQASGQLVFDPLVYLWVGDLERVRSI
jgi:hypothetical protein